MAEAQLATTLTREVEDLGIEGSPYPVDGIYSALNASITNALNDDLVETQRGKFNHLLG